MHGRSRSKAIVRLLETLGYTNVRMVGIRDYSMPHDERDNLLKQADLIVPVASDVTAEVKNRLKSLGIDAAIKPVELTEKEHAILHYGTKDEQAALLADLERRLVEAGFQRFHPENEMLASQGVPL